MANERMSMLLTLIVIITYTTAQNSCEHRLRNVLLNFSPDEMENCVTAEQMLIDAIEVCDADDAVYAMALLRKAVNALESEGCLGEPPFGDPDCHEIFACFRPVFTSASSSFFCGPQDRNVQLVSSCLANKRCGLSVSLQSILSSASTELCKGGACLNDAGVFRTIPGSSCSRYTWLVPETGRSYNFNAPPGTIFGVDICHHRFTGNSPCWN